MEHWPSVLILCFQGKNVFTAQKGIYDSLLILRCMMGVLGQVGRSSSPTPPPHLNSELCLFALICPKLRILPESNGTSGPSFNQISSLKCISICLSCRCREPKHKEVCISSRSLRLRCGQNEENKRRRRVNLSSVQPLQLPPLLPVKPPQCPWASLLSNCRVQSGGMVTENSCGV